jgi:uncharacterized protein YndB with AHSA1/START domain
MNDGPGQISRCYSLTFARQLAQTPQRLWRAITDSREVSTWMAHPATVDARVGGRYFVDFTRTGGLDIDGVICGLEPEKRLAYAWGTMVTEWTIEAEGSGCRYRLLLNGLEPGRIPEDAFAAGWHCQLTDLEQYLSAGAPRSDAEARQQWLTLRPPYAERANALLGATR